MLSLQEIESQGLPSLMPATAKSVVLRVTRAKPVTCAGAAIKESIDTTQKLICDEGGGTNTNVTPWREVFQRTSYIKGRVSRRKRDFV